MEFRIADTFIDSLARLTGEEQKAVKTVAFDLQLNPANPGMSSHRLDRAKDKNFWSVRVNSDLRLIVHRSEGSLLLCYVGHHDKAYEWAEKRKLETHPATGAAQLVEIRETVQEIFKPVYVEAPKPAPTKELLFANVSDDVLLSYGVPEEWLGDVRRSTEDTILDIAEHLPGEAAEALLEYVVSGSMPEKPKIEAPANPFDHPDAQRRFRTMSNIEELQQALEYPWEKWCIFLHPEQRRLVEQHYTGPFRVSGSAGTGKTIVALHRAVFLARKDPDARVLLTTYSDALANALQARLNKLVYSEPRLAERIDVYSIDTIGIRLYKSHFGPVTLASKEDIFHLLKEAAARVRDHKFSLRFLFSEWKEIVDAWQLGSWEEYRNVVRLGRKTRLPQQQRSMLWSIFSQVQTGLKNRNLITHATLFYRLAQLYSDGRKPPFDYVVVDEAQDISIAHVRFFAALGANRPNALFFAGDLGQRIFQQPFSWLKHGVDVRGRSHTLRVNYRTSHQIRTQADRLLEPVMTDIDGNVEDRSRTVSVFNGPMPLVKRFENENEEVQFVGNWLTQLITEGVAPQEIAIFVRSEKQLDRAQAAVENTEIPYRILDENVSITSGSISICTMHLAKGLEFKAVAVMACDDEVIPLQERIETIGDDADLREVYNTERHLLYVACTRARDYLLITSVEPASEFLDDMGRLRSINTVGYPLRSEAVNPVD